MESEKNTPAIEVTQLEKSYTGSRGIKTPAVRSVSFSVEPGEFFSLVGASGCGKTTTLRSIAGLERPDAGTVRLGQRVVSSDKEFVPSHGRDIGMVFQSYAIWPHMSVFDNVAFPLRERRGYRGDIREATMNALRTVQLDHLAERGAPYLSGGQQQRVALARAIVGRPAVLLLDEPLSNLDARLREEMRYELGELTREIGITTIHVTHDQTEALVLADRIAIMRDGVIEEIGAPETIYRRPKSAYTAAFLGDSNLLHGRVVSARSDGMGTVTVETASGVLVGSCTTELSGGQEVQLMLRPHLLGLGTDTPLPGDGWNVVDGTVQSVWFVGDYTKVTVVSNGGDLLTAHLQISDVLETGVPISLMFHRRDTWLLAGE